MSSSQDLSIHIQTMDFNPHDSEITITGNCPSHIQTFEMKHDNSTKTISNTAPWFTIKHKLDKSKQTSLCFSANDAALTLTFVNHTAKLSSEKSYWRAGNFIVSHNNTAITFAKYYISRHVLYELRTLWSIISARKLKPLVLRIAYIITQPFFKKNIWLFSDKMYMAADNAEYLYRYSLNQKDDAKKYYILSKKSPDAHRFRQSRLKFVPHGSLYHRLLFLNSKLIFFTENNVPNCHCFSPENECFFRGLFNYDVLYIQHGLTIQNMSWMLNRSLDNFKLFFVASHFETENLLKDGYGYSDQQIVKSGLPRYDTLVNDPSKTILIAPTWRKSLEQFMVDGHIEGFRKTSYFKTYNSLINHPQLLESAQKHGYNIVFLLHPLISSEINTFKRNDIVDIVESTDSAKYKLLLTKSSLMVTDYSGVQFDFAYMNKPIVYFHPPETPPSYEEGVFKYSRHALGEITTSLDQLVNLIDGYMRNNCLLKQEYQKRINGFFYHRDYRNCERIYTTAIKYQREHQYINRPS